jgi:hypothetical protein
MTSPTTTRTWTIVMRAPAPWLNANDRLNRYIKAEYTSRWRAAAFVAAARAKLPKGLARVRVEPVFHFAVKAHRDAPNLYPTVKACIDGFGPQFLRVPKGKFRGASAPGYGLIPDDTAEHLDLVPTVIGEPYQVVEKALGLPPATALPWGCALVFTITDISPEVTDAA